MESKGLVGLCLPALLIALVVGGASAQASKRSQKEQSHFGAEVVVRKPVEIPIDVLSILREDKRNQTCLSGRESPTGITSSWFVGSKIQLSEEDLADLVVTARNECLWGANLVPFWVFRTTPHGHELVLSVSALGLDVLNTKTNNYRDIRTGAATARSNYTVIFKFDGKEYRAKRVPQKRRSQLITKKLRYKSLNRRSQRRGYGWEEFERVAKGASAATTASASTSLLETANDRLRSRVR